MRRKRVLYTIIAILFIIALYKIMPSLLNMKNKDAMVSALKVEPISFTKTNSIHFYEEGFIMTGSPARFYNWKGIDSTPPLKQDDLIAENNNVNIILQTEDFIVTDKNRIYDTKTIPFTLVYENDELTIWDIKQFGDFLFLLVKRSENKVEPVLLVQNSSFLISLDGMGNSKYLTADDYDGSKEFSLLTMNMDTPVTFSRVFHFKNRNELYGVLTLDDTFIYNIYRLKSNIVLIGIDSILCYNIEGQKKWEIQSRGNEYLQTVLTDKGLIMYSSDNNQMDNKKGNTILIKNNGEYSVINFPKYLTNLQSYKNGYIGLEYKNTLVFLDAKGKVTDRKKLQDQVEWMGTTALHPDYFYLRTNKDSLVVYTNNLREEE